LFTAKASSSNKNAEPLFASQSLEEALKFTLNLKDQHKNEMPQYNFFPPQAKQGKKYSHPVPVSAMPLVTQTDIVGDGKAKLEVLSKSDTNYEAQICRKLAEVLKMSRNNIEKNSARNGHNANTSYNGDRHGMASNGYAHNNRYVTLGGQRRDTSNNYTDGRRESNFRFGRNSNSFNNRRPQLAFKAKKKAKPIGPKKVEISYRHTLAELSQLMGVKTSSLERSVREWEGLTASGYVCEEIAEIIVKEHGMEPIVKSRANRVVVKREANDPNLPERAPVVCVLGHVDHGKTTLLDSLRNSQMADAEKGGITQKLGAFTVKSGKKSTTFLDTPGHAAFKRMRHRGIAATDVAVLVVSIDDGVMPQTLESIRLVKEAEVPIVVALNKCDLDVDRAKVRSQLKQCGLHTEQDGGDVLCVEISAKNKVGLEELLENIFLQSEMMTLTAENKGRAECVVLGSSTQKMGHVINVIVSHGELKVGDYFVCGQEWGKVKALIDDQNKRVKSVMPSRAVCVTGVKSVESIGNNLVVVGSEMEAREMIEEMKRKSEVDSMGSREETDIQADAPAAPDRVKFNNPRKRGKVTVKKMSAEEIEAEANVTSTTLPVIVKADAAESLQTLVDYFTQLPTDEVRVEIIRHGLGAITEADVRLAMDFDAQILGYGVKAPGKIQTLARQQDIFLSTQPVIYTLMDEIKEMLSAKLPTTTEVQVVGKASVEAVYAVKNGHAAAGCVVKSGEMKAKATSYRVIRDQEVIHTGELGSLRNVQQEINTAAKGSECGISMKDFGGFKKGDQIECVIEKVVRREFDDHQARLLPTLDLNEFHSNDPLSSSSIRQMYM